MIYEWLFRKRDECGGDGRSHNSHNSGGDDDERNPTESPGAGQRNDKHSNPPTQFSVNGERLEKLATPSTVSSFLLLDFFEKRSLGTWKRSRNHQFSHKKDRRGFKSLKKFDLFSSSPNLLDKSYDISDQDNIRKSSLQLESPEVLQFTSRFTLIFTSVWSLTFSHYWEFPYLSRMERGVMITFR